jgi:peptidoglycan/xylan/chitin deacetylase (PgdA/CDA1 family)
MGEGGTALPAIRKGHAFISQRSCRRREHATFEGIGMMRLVRLVLLIGLIGAIPLLRGRAADTPATRPVEIPPRAKPPIIVLKLDDLKQHYGGNVHPRWQKVADYLREKKVKAGFGVICETLEKADPKYVEWIKSRQQTGEIEFWFHGFDHKVHEVGGQKYNEFNMRSYEEQKERLEKSQKLAKEKLGFTFHAFGPPGGVGTASFNDDTLRIMIEDPDMHVMLFPGPLNDAGRKAMASSNGKLVILDYPWQVRLERPLFKPNFDAFVAGYAKFPKREYFVLQGHPAAWTDESFEQFKKIVEFLITQKAEFMTPSEAAKAVQSEATAPQPH